MKREVESQVLESTGTWVALGFQGTDTRGDFFFPLAREHQNILIDNTVKAESN